MNTIAGPRSVMLSDPAHDCQFLLLCRISKYLQFLYIRQICRPTRLVNQCFFGCFLWHTAEERGSAGFDHVCRFRCVMPILAELRGSKPSRGKDGFIFFNRELIGQKKWIVRYRIGMTLRVQEGEDTHVSTAAES